MQELCISFREGKAKCLVTVRFAAMKKYICIHGHFYQPPRENAWLEVVEQQPSAAPFHDWNERINAECYGPNAASRVLNDEQRIIDIVNNYAQISFNIGPTLMSWIATHDPETYHNILLADKQSILQHDGHGNALAQVYNHVIMPLASERDKETQVLWGIADFMHRFNRKPEGMWLAETAVDTATLDMLAKHDIKFTILAPRQAKALRASGDDTWLSVDEQSVDTTRPYVVHLPSGRSIAVFFYNGRISRDVAFAGLLNSGKIFAEALVNATPSADHAQLIHIATDGESYGHHHYRGDMALASCLRFLQSNPDVQLVNYAQYLAMFPPQYEVRIHENSSWSCVHGVERWRSNCGCTDGGNPGFHQKWREPLRNALNWLKDQADVIFEQEFSAWTNNPWHTRNQYIAVVLQRDAETIDRFLQNCCHVKLSGEQKIRAIRLLEMQRHAMLMFTSCGWFFDEVSRIETKQILQYADRVIQIAEHETQARFFDQFMQLLELAPSNIEKYVHAAGLYRAEIRPQRLTLTKVGLHHAVLSLFDSGLFTGFRLNYKIEADFFEKITAGDLVLSVGSLRLQSTFTYASEKLYFAALYLGQHHVIGGYADMMDDDKFEELFLDLRDAFRKSCISDMTLLIHAAFGSKRFTLDDVFADDREKLIKGMLERDILTAEDAYRSVYHRTYTLVNMLRIQNKPIPELLADNTNVVINADLKRWFFTQSRDVYALDQLVTAAIDWKVELDQESLGITAAQYVYRLVKDLSLAPYDFNQLDLISQILIRLHELDIKFRLWRIQNAFFKIGKEHIGNKAFIRNIGEEEYKKWLLKCKAVGEQLKIRL